MFDVPPETKLRRSWSVNLPLEEREWNVGLVVGPSGSGKTSLLEELRKGEPLPEYPWAASCLLDDFPREMGIKQIVGLLCAVGFSSPPDWLKPYGCLSNGEQFRVGLARVLAETQGEAVAYVDEFTSVVDRNVAQIASAALAKQVRRDKRKVILASCHYDILEWLTPDWVCQPHLERFEWSECLQRPAIELEIRRVHHSAWQVFAPYHYLSADLNKSARCFVAFWKGLAVAFTAVLPFVGLQKRGDTRTIWRESRTVCLPDYQGVGIGTKMSEVIGGMVAAIGARWTSSTSHPAMIGARLRSARWALTRKSSFSSEGGRNEKLRIVGGVNATRAISRLTCGFEYIGPPWPDAAEARRVWDGV